MSLPPRLAATVLTSGQAGKAKHTVELFFDYRCKYSTKLFRTLYDHVVPSLGPFASSVNFVLRPQIQPWHPASLYMTESALAVLALTQDEKVFWQYSSDLYNAEPEYKDNSLLREGRNETYKRLAALAHKSVGVDENKLLQLLEVPDSDEDNKVIKDVKYIIRYNRTVGVHMTPTVAFDGIIDDKISSSFSKDQWLQWLSDKVDKS